MSDAERKRCATCRYLDYFERYEKGEIEDQWWCRFMPTPVQVNPTHWCGQWEDEEEEEQQRPDPPDPDRGITAS